MSERMSDYLYTQPYVTLVYYLSCRQSVMVIIYMQIQGCKARAAPAIASKILRVRADILAHARINIQVNLSRACFEMAD